MKETDIEKEKWGEGEKEMVSGISGICLCALFISSQASGQMMSWSNVFVIRGDRTLEMEDGYFFNWVSPTTLRYLYTIGWHSSV